MPAGPRTVLAVTLAAAVALVAGGCGHPDPAASASLKSIVPTGVPATTAPASASPSASPSASASPSTRPAAPPAPRLVAGNPAGHAGVPAAGRPVDTSHPTRVVGHGTPASCTSAAVVSAVAAGGVITFDCGPGAVTITMTKTAKLRNASPDVVLDGGGRVTLSGGGKRRILYLNTCDQAQGWTTDHCNDQDHPKLTVQNLVLAAGNSTGDQTDGGGGGAIFDRGGHLKVVNSKFVRNRCDSTGPDLGGAAIRALDQGGGDPVYVVQSTFGGASGQGGVCSNGGALSSIGVSWVVVNCLLSFNSAIGFGANPADSGTPGGGSGGAIYTDGNTYTVKISGTRVESNHAKEGGGAIFYVSNDRTGTLGISSSTLRRNPSDGFETSGFPGIFFLGSGRPVVSGSTLR